MILLSSLPLPKMLLCSFKRTSSYYRALMCLLLLPMPVFAVDNVGIEVSGQGSVVVTPDQFSLTLTVTERGRVPSKLKALVDKKSNAVIKTANSLNIKSANISSARVNLRIINEKPSIQLQGIEMNKARHGSVYIDGKNIKQQATTNQHQDPLFELSRQITVHFKQLSDYDRFLTQIIKIKVSHISSLSMSVKNRDDFYQQALLIAITHAKKKAQKMAWQADAELGSLQFIKESSSNHYRPMYAEAMMSNTSSRAHTSLIGNQTITAKVLIRFSLEN